MLRRSVSWITRVCLAVEGLSGRGNVCLGGVTWRIELLTGRLALLAVSCLSRGNRRWRWIFVVVLAIS